MRKNWFCQLRRKGLWHLPDRYRQALEESPAESLFVKRDPLPVNVINTQFTHARPYSHIPKQFLIVPTLINEEVLAQDNDVFNGQAALKAGFIADVMDPLAMVDMGTELGAYLFFGTA